MNSVIVNQRDPQKVSILDSAETNWSTGLRSGIGFRLKRLRSIQRRFEPDLPYLLHRPNRLQHREAPQKQHPKQEPNPSEDVAENRPE
ncbi:MAG: hypothetical protein ACJ0BJ_04555 [Pirellulales bacterium]